MQIEADEPRRIMGMGNRIPSFILLRDGIGKTPFDLQVMAPLFGFGAGAALLEKNRFLLPRKGEKGKPFLTLFFRSVTSRGRLIR